MMRISGTCMATRLLIVASSLFLLMLLACAPPPPATATPAPTPGLVVGKARSWSPDGCYLYTSPLPHEVECAEWERVKIGDVWP